MSKEYKTIRVPKPVFAELEDVKREGETWEGLMRRLLDANGELETLLYGDGIPDGEVYGDSKIKEVYEKMVELEEMQNHLPEKTADELEGRMR